MKKERDEQKLEQLRQLEEEELQIQVRKQELLQLKQELQSDTTTQQEYMDDGKIDRTRRKKTPVPQQTQKSKASIFRSRLSRIPSHHRLKLRSPSRSIPRRPSITDAHAFYNNNSSNHHPSSPSSTPHLLQNSNTHRPLHHTRSTSTSAISLVSIASQQQQQVNATTDSDSIVVNGKVFKCKRRGSMLDKNNNNNTNNVEGYNPSTTTIDRNSSLYEKVILGGSGEIDNALEFCNSIDSKSGGAGTTSAAGLTTCTTATVTTTTSGNDSGTGEQEEPSVGYASSSIVASTSSGTVDGKQRLRRKKRRAMKEEFKYLMGKMVPGPLRALTRKRSYGLEKISGCLA